MNRHADPEAPSTTGPLQWLLLGIVILVAIGTAIVMLQMLREPPAPATPVVLAQPRARIEPVMPLPALGQAPAALATAATPPAPAAAACPMQQLSLALPPAAAAQTVCVDNTRVRQNGSVRSYVVQGSGSEQWQLQVDVAGGAVVDVALSSRGGARFACATLGCAGVGLGRHDARGVRSLSLAALQLAADGPAAEAAQPARAVVSARFEVPADAQVPGLACTGPSVQIASPDGSAHPFCGQGGAGVEFADDGSRAYRFQDHEGRTLSVVIDAGQHISRVEYGASSCRGDACSGASMTVDGSPSATPGELSARSFFFGRTPLFSGASARPDSVLDGSLVMPAQE